MQTDLASLPANDDNTGVPDIGKSKLPPLHQTAKEDKLPHKITSIKTSQPESVKLPAFANNSLTKTPKNPVNFNNIQLPSAKNIGKPELIVEPLTPHPTAELKKQQPFISKDNPTPLVTPPPNKPTTEDSQADPNYIISPRIVPNAKINSFTTTLPLNGIPISHLTKWETFQGVSFGKTQNTNYNFNGIVKLQSQVTENLSKDNIFTVEQTGSYFQLQTVRQSRQVIVSRQDAQTVFGTQIQMSLTADCIFPGTKPTQQCTYTPGLVTDRQSIDSQSLVPTRVFQTSKVGDVVTPETLAAIKQPGFQRGANGQEIGIDLEFPNSGSFSGNSQVTQPTYTRKEETSYTPAGFYSQVKQVVRANDHEAVLGRTVRGYGLVVDDSNTLINSAVQLGNLWLPDAEPEIQGGTKPVNTNINKNLFLAANNVFLPANSLTIYHAGIGHAESTPSNITSLNQIKNASFNSIWIGLTPVTQRTFTKNTRYQTSGQAQILADAGAEGGVNANVNLLSLINNQPYSSANLHNFYAQIYLQNTTQNVNLINSSILSEKTQYFPHISFTGDITGTDNVWRYYAGVITGNTTKAYLGGDVTKQTVDGWTYSAGAIGYLNPDRDYYSQLLASLAKKVSLGKNTNLVLSSSINYALDRETRIGKSVVISPASSLTVGARANVGPVSFGLVNYFGNILPDSIDNTLLADLAIKFSNRFSLSGYYTPVNESSSRSNYGAKAEYKLGDQNNSPTLAVSWTNNEYYLDQNATGKRFNTTDNVFAVFLKFGEER